MQGPGRPGTAALEPACETTTACAGAGFCPVRASAVTLIGLVLWVMLARSSFLEPEEVWATKLGPAYQQAGSVLSLGLSPWVGVIVLLSILGALARPVSEWLCGRTPCERGDVYKWVGALSLISFFAAANARVSWAHAVAYGPLGANLPIVPGPDIFAGLLLGSFAAAAILVLVQKAGPGSAFSLCAVFSVVAILAPRLGLYAHHLRAHWFVGGIQLVLMVVTGFALVWLIGMTYEAPADLTPGGRDAPPIQVPVLIVGVIPLIGSEIALKILRGALRGMSAEFEIYGTLARFFEGLLAPGSLLGAVAQVALVWLLTTVTFSVLYPSHRLESIFGLSRERIDESLESFLDGLLIQNALILCGVYLIARLCGATFFVLGLSPAGFVVLVAGLAALRRNLLMRRALEDATGGLTCAKTVLGQLEGEVARARLAAAGIPSYLNGWTLQELHPVTIAGMGEMQVLVPHRVVDEARKLLA